MSDTMKKMVIAVYGNLYIGNIDTEKLYSQGGFLATATDEEIQEAIKDVYWLDVRVIRQDIRYENIQLGDDVQLCIYATGGIQVSSDMSMMITRSSSLTLNFPTFYAIQGDILNAPINPQEVYKLLGVGKYNGWWDITFICLNSHGKTNRYSYIKPVKGTLPTETTFNDTIYKNSLDINTYKVGNSHPAESSYVYGYNSPIENVDFSRITDWIGYDHTEGPCKVDFSSVPTSFDYDNTNVKIEIDLSVDNSQRNLMQKLVSKHTGTANPIWYSGVLYICERSGYTSRYLVYKSNQYPTFFNVGFYNDLVSYDLFRSINIQNYKVTAIAIIIPTTHPGNFDYGFTEVTASQGYTFMIYPEAFGAKPYKGDITISRPRTRVFWRYAVWDSGTTQSSYIPDDAAFNIGISLNGDSLWNPGTTTWREMMELAGSSSGGVLKQGNFVVNTGDKLTAGLMVPDYYVQNLGWIRPMVSTSGKAVYDSVQHTTEITWEFSGSQLDGDLLMDTNVQYDFPD